MLNFRASILTPAAALCGLVLAAAAQATPQTVAFQDVNGSSEVNVTYNIGNNQSQSEKVYAGDYHISLDGGPSQSAFCTDLFDNAYTGETWNVNSYQTSASNGLASASSYYAVGPYNVNAIDYIGETYAAAGISDSRQAAAQLAIWDLVDGGGLTMTAPNDYQWSSNFSETGVAQSSVYSIEQAALAASGPQGSQWLQVIDGSQNPSKDGRPQDFVVSVPAQGGHGEPMPVPEPSSLLGMGMGMFGLGALSLRARRRAKA